MTSVAASGFRGDSLAHRLALMAVGLTAACGAIVFTEPAPFDVLALGLLVLLPAVGLVHATPAMVGYFAVMLIPVGCAFAGVLAAINPGRALTHTAVTLFLMLTSFLISAFVSKAPQRHALLICRGTVVAGLVAAGAGLIGYLDLFPGSYDLFTLYGRVSGTFKDPNVFGAFLVLPATYLIHAVLVSRGWRAGLSALGLAVLVLGVLLSFSRGAWFSLAVAGGLYTFFALVTSRSSAQRLRIAVGLGGALVAATVVVGAALQFETVSNLMAERATLTQGYDEGPEGRFGGQVKAKRLILAHPFGLGAQQFDPYYHIEEAHNVYLSMFMNAGWLGGLVFAIMVAATVLAGARHALKGGPVQGLFLVAYAAFVAHALEGFVIDLDHWRHFHLLMALCWGLMLSERVAVPTGLARATRLPRQVRSMSPQLAHMAS